MTSNQRSFGTPVQALEAAEPHLRQRDWPFTAAVAILVLLLTSVPATYALLSTPPDRYYTGVVYNIPDHNQYFAWMRDLAHANLAPNRLTAEPNEPALFHLLWWSTGRVAATLNISVGTAFGTLRVVAAAAMLAVAYAFFRLVIADQSQRRLAFIVFALGGGLGVLWVAVKYLRDMPDAPFPFDIYTSEPNSFFLALAFPHFAVALTLMIAMIGLTLLSYQRQQLRYAVGAGILGALVGLQHAYDLLTIAAVLVLFGLLVWWRDRRFPAFLLKAGIIIALFTVPPGAYLSYLVLTDATWGGKLEQFDNAGAWTPGLIHLPILLGAPLLLALFAFRPRMLRSTDNGELLIAGWFLVHFALVYLPVSFQIHLLLGWQVPIAVLASTTLIRVARHCATKGIGRLGAFAVAAFLGLCVVTNLYLVLWRVVDLGRHEAPYYLTSNEVAALRWLEQHTSREDVVLGRLEINQHVPVWTDARAFLAHWAGTLRYYDKLDAVDSVLSLDTAPHTRALLLDSASVTYVIVREVDTPREQFTAAASGELTPVFHQGEITVYRRR